MRTCHTSPIKLLEIDKHKQCNTLNINDLGGGYCATDNPFNLLIDNLFRCHKKVPDGCVVSCGQKSNDSKFHVENVGLNNGFGGRHNV